MMERMFFSYPSPYCSAWRITFSVITIPASTSTPIAMAIPPRLMMLELSPT